MSGSEMMRNKDDVAAIMRKKQAAGMCSLPKGLQGLKATNLTQRLISKQPRRRRRQRPQLERSEQLLVSPKEIH
jgi:hypothetical protein